MWGGRPAFPVLVGALLSAAGCAQVELSELSRHSAAYRASGWHALVRPAQWAVLGLGCCAALREARRFVAPKTASSLEPVLAEARSGMASPSLWK
jgi:hypothetical protein